MNKHVIVSRYKDNINWVNKLTHPYTIIDKENTKKNNNYYFVDIGSHIGLITRQVANLNIKIKFFLLNCFPFKYKKYD